MQDSGLLSPRAAERTRALLSEGRPLEEAVLAADGVSEEALLRFLGSSLDLPYVDLEKSPPPREFLAQFPARLLLKHHVLPLEERDGVTLLATSRPSDAGAIDELRLLTGRDFAVALAPSAEIDRTLKRLLGVGADTLQTLNAGATDLQVIDADQDDDIDLANAAQDASIIKFVNQILTEAIEMRATDVHIEPFEDQLRLRNRIDGEADLRTARC